MGWTSTARERTAIYVVLAMARIVHQVVGISHIANVTRKTSKDPEKNQSGN
jgi:hypothetical protein